MVVVAQFVGYTVPVPSIINVEAAAGFITRVVFTPMSFKPTTVSELVFKTAPASVIQQS